MADTRGLLDRIAPELRLKIAIEHAVRRGLPLPPLVRAQVYGEIAVDRGLTKYDSFSEFVQARNPTLLQYDHVSKLIDVAERIVSGELTRVMVLIPTQYFKALADDTPIATPSGWKAMGRLVPGDHVCDADGKPTKVLAVQHWSNRPTYRVSGTDGDVVVADEEHLWQVRQTVPHGSEWIVRKTADLAAGRTARIPLMGQLSSPFADRLVSFAPGPVCATTCIMVENNDGLFLAGRSLMVTHNSEIFSRLLPAYYLLKFPNRVVALASYGADLAWELSSEARDHYAAAGGKFKVGSLKGTSRNWQTARTRGGRGRMWAAGVDGQYLGKGFNLGIVDDPVDPRQAGSRAYQRRWANWWPGQWLRGERPVHNAIVMVMQRLGVDDPIAWLLEREQEAIESGDLNGAHSWHIVACDEIKSSDPFAQYKGPRGFPTTCTAEPDDRKVGEILSPNWRPLAEVKKKQAQAGPIIAAAQRQQRPMLPSGDFWQAAFFKDRTFDVLPPTAFDVGWDWDLAYSTNEANSASAGVRSARGPGDLLSFPIYVDDVDWDWLEFPEMITWMKEKQGPHYVEQKASGKSAVQVLKSNGIVAKEVPVTKDKLARAAAAQPAAQSGRIYVSKRAMQKLLYGEGQGLLRVTAEGLQEGGEGLDVNDAFVQMVWRHLKINSKQRKMVVG